ncbi:hypothetical protein HCN44_002023 [Aphidius gifuensis]|uniref:Mediator of RNA polymerase II transcription subunit 27 n=1 Tax=Aphidius gifuensis TaxID=684658 RepID=A0A834Y4I9_APHGI|nr:mediator of RNA polymerase II transcription subunit 27 [Aphidius gifuensis]KAF7996391.1 hypothetical protein HCN44_002023 [Aphidius gifuensis]
MEQLQNSLIAIKVLRSSVGQVFDSLGNGLRADHGEENREEKYIAELQELFTTISSNIRDVEQAVSQLNPPPGPFNLSSTSHLSQETTQERQALYSTLVNSYKWTDKVHEYSNAIQAIVTKNSLKRTYTTGSSRSKRGKPQASIHTVSQQQVESMVAVFDRLYHYMSVTVSRPITSIAVMQVTVGHVLKAVVGFRGLLIERVVVKGYNETIDLWSESRYKVFRKVTDNAHAAILHFHAPQFPELAVKSFMLWIGSYLNLFSEPCKRCGLHLHSALPPTWHDFRTLEPFHYECKS